MSTDEITVREATRGDVAALDEILRSLGWFDQINRLAPVVSQASMVSSLIGLSVEGPNTLFVAETDRVVGYIFVHWLPNLLFGLEGYISELFVHPEAQSRGLGSALLEAVKAVAIRRGCSRLVLFNRRERESYQRGFYTKRGWVERDDAALMMYYLR